MARIRADLALTIAAAALIGLGAQQITTRVVEANNRPAEYMAEVYTDGTVGAQADDSIPRAATIAEIKSQDGLFTVELGDLRDYQSIANRDDFYSLKLGSGEYVFARVLKDSITKLDERGTYVGSYIQVMPIGQVVWEPVPEDVLELAERYYNLPDDDSFYIDMRGGHKAGTQYTPKDAKSWGESAFILTTLVMMVVIWQIMVRVGLFPPLLPRRGKKAGQEEQPR